MSTLSCRITLKNNGDYYFINCLHSFRTKNRIKNVCKSDDYRYIEMPGKGINMSKYNYEEKSMKVPFVIYIDTESLLEKK